MKMGTLTRRLWMFGANCIGTTILCLTLTASHAMAEEQKTPGGHYWRWGWGVNNTSFPQNPLDTARFDWSTIALGNVGANQTTLDYLNRVLELNPEHRFLLGVWPTTNLGARNPQNRFQTTMWDYFYTPGQKDRLLERMKEQITFILEGLSDPKSIVAFVFCEELPLPVASTPRSWRRDEQPWDIRAFAEAIEADLGEPFNMTSTEHRLWWGRKFAEFFGEIHHVMKQVGDGRTVVFWPQIAMVGTLDELEEGQSFEINERGTSLLPFYYRDIVKPGLCDGILGFPGNRFEERTVNPARKLDCLYFTQISTPGFMRRHSWERIVSIARLEDPRNLGTMIHIEPDRSTGRPVPWRGDIATKVRDMRMIGLRKQLGMELLEKHLKPEVKLDYDLEAVNADGYVQVFAQVFNPVSTTWYGDDVQRATFQNVSIRLESPSGFNISRDLSAPATVAVGNLTPYECFVANWWLEKTTGAASADPLLRVILTYADGKELIVESRSLKSEIPSLQPHRAIGLGERWVEPAYRLASFEPAVTITPLGRDLIHPTLVSGNRTVTYQDTVRHDEMLTIGPGMNGSIVQKALFEESVRRFGNEHDQARAFSDGNIVFRTPRVTLRSKATYRFKLTGRAEEGGNCNVLLRFTSGKETKDVYVFTNRFGDNFRTLETEVTVPEFEDDKPVQLQIFFYRLKQTGTVFYKDFSFEGGAPPRDVTNKLSGSLRPIERFATTWEFHDQSAHDFTERPKAIIQFVHPDGKGRRTPDDSPFF